MKTILDEILEKMSDEFNMMELFAKVEEKTPYVLVALQECERMNTLTSEMKRSLKEVDLGLKVHLSACSMYTQWNPSIVPTFWCSILYRDLGGLYEGFHCIL